jgi:hypothetical protein
MARPFSNLLTCNGKIFQENLSNLTGDFKHFHAIKLIWNLNEILTNETEKNEKCKIYFLFKVVLNDLIMSLGMREIFIYWTDADSEQIENIVI